MRPLRVVIVDPYFHEGKFGGAELWVREVGLGLQARGHDVTIVTTNLTRHQSAFEPKAPRRGTAWGLKVRRHRVSLLAGLLAKPAGFFPVAPGILLDRAIARADVVIVSGIEDPTSALGVVAARLRSRPVVVQAHTHMDLVRRMGPDRRILLAPFEGSASCYVQLNTEAEAPFWRARLEPRRVLPAVGCGVHPLPPGADVPRDAARRALGLPQDEGVVLFLGRLHWAKGLLRAAAAMEGLGSGAKLYLVGFEETHPAKRRGRRVQLRDYLAERFPRDGPVIVGDVDEERKRLWLGACDLLVLPSHHESFGIVFLEAWQHGKPVVGWRQGGMPEVVADGKDGFIVASIGELRDRIATLLAKPGAARAMGEAGRAKVAQHYQWEHVVERVEVNLGEVFARERARVEEAQTSEEIREVER